MSEDLIKKEPINLSTPNYEIENRIMQETDLDELKNIVNIFNINIKKKDLLRAGRISDLQDQIVDQMTQRITKKGNEFSNTDLLNYFKIAQDTLSKQDNSLDNVPQIQINQNQVNINMGEDGGLSRASKEKVTDAIKAILARAAAQAETNIQEEDSGFIEITPEEDEKTEVNPIDSELSED